MAKDVIKKWLREYAHLVLLNLGLLGIGTIGTIVAIETLNTNAPNVPLFILVILFAGVAIWGMVLAIKKEVRVADIEKELGDSKSEVKRLQAENGTYRNNLYGKDFPKIQVISVQEMLDGSRLDLPTVLGVLKSATKKAKGGKQDTLL